MPELSLEAPPPLIETVDLYATNGRIRGLDLKVALHQARHSDVYGFRDGSGLLVAAFGFYPISAKTLELWFVTRPEWRRHVLGFVRLARLTLNRCAEDTGLRIIAHVAADHEPGKRLARLCGMRFSERAGRAERFEWSGANGTVSQQSAAEHSKRAS